MNSIGRGPGPLTGGRGRWPGRGPRAGGRGPGYKNHDFILKVMITYKKS